MNRTYEPDSDDDSVIDEEEKQEQEQQVNNHPLSSSLPLLPSALQFVEVIAEDDLLYIAVQVCLGRRKILFLPITLPVFWPHLLPYSFVFNK